MTDDYELLNTEYSYFRFKIHEQCYNLVKAKPDCAEFVRWLQDNGWTIIICPYQDLRRVNNFTKQWLKDNNIPYDYLIYVQSKIVFCKMWGIKHLIDSYNLNILYGEDHGINIYYSLMNKQAISQASARGFNNFYEVKQWIQE